MQKRVSATLMVLSLLGFLSLGSGEAASAELSAGSRLVPVVDQAATPPGWVPVDVGDTQLSVPPTWELLLRTGEAGCGAVVGVLVFEGGQWCPANLNATAPADVSVVTIATITGRVKDHSLRRMMVNGIPIYAGTGGSSYLIPSLNAELTFAGPPQTRVLHSLTYSPRYVALAAGRAPTVPRSWKLVTFAHLRFAVPKAWKISVNAHEDGCPSNDYLFVAGVTLVKGPAAESVGVPTGPCGMPPLTAVPQVAGMEVDDGAWAEVPSLFNPPQCVGSGVINDLRVCIRATPDLGLVIVQVGYTGVDPVTVKIGMAGSGTDGRIILDSMRRS